MKTIITVLLALTASIVLSQNTTTTTIVTKKKATTENLVEALTKLSEQLEGDTQKESTVTEEDLKSFTEVLKSIQGEIKIDDTFSKTILHKDSTSSSTTYKIHLDKDSDIGDLKDLEEADFEGLKETLEEFVVALQDSPKMNELKKALRNLEEKYPAPSKN